MQEVRAKGGKIDCQHPGKTSVHAQLWLSRLEFAFGDKDARFSGEVRKFGQDVEDATVC